MIAIEFRNLSMSEAEEVITALWCCFEEYDVPSPAMTFKFSSCTRASMQVHIEDANLARIVTQFLSNWNVGYRSDASDPIASRRSELELGGWAPITGKALETRH